MADSSPMRDEIHVHGMAPFWRNQRTQCMVRGICRRMRLDKSQPLCHAQYVSINWKGRLPQIKEQDTCRSFGSNTRQFFEEVERTI
jgi:hypothetical protein